MSDLPVLELVTDRVRPAVRHPVEASVPVTLDEELTTRLDELCATLDVPRSTVLMAVWQLLMGRYGNTRDVAVGTGTAVVRTSWTDDPAFAAFVGRAAVEEHSDAARCRVAMAMTGLPLGERDLALSWQSVDGGLRGVLLRGVLRYDATVFDHATVERMVSHHDALLRSALTAPETRVTELAHTTADERATLARWGSDTSAGRPLNLVDGFRCQAEATPDAVALVFDDETLTYAQLRDRSERLAAALVRHGVEPETVVGLAIDRSAALVVAMLAVVTAGAAYLPLDPEYPDARLEFMVADSGARLVLADRELSWTCSAPVVRLSDVDLGGPPPRWDPHPGQRACVLYTSGSTGRPKGVETTHRGIVRLVCDAAFFGCDRTDVVAQASSPSFDSASLEIWGALLNGARLAGIPKDEVLSTVMLGDRVKTHAVTAMFLATSVFHVHADVTPGIFAPLRVLFFGGEPADARRVAATRVAAPGVRLVNGYGPTECTTFASTFNAEDTEPGAAGLPIGGPIPETTLHVLDARGRETGLGVPGELYIGGSGLARGYTGRPDLTAERFVPSPFGAGARLYRTGDLARWREDGLLECLGRVDTQVKIRGVRIEPEEIASVLGTHPDVRAAVVEARGDGDARRLVAYVVPSGGRPVLARELRAHLADRLPQAMVPTWYVPLPALPLTPNGKLDRQALPEPAEDDAVHAEVHVAPQGEAERLVADIWAEVLGVAAVSATDDFLALGGNSLLATRVVAHLGARLGVRLGIGDLFEAPTVAALAARVTTARRSDTDPPLVAAGDGPAPLSHAQHRLWFLDKLAPGNPLYTVSLVLALDGVLDVPALADGIQGLVRRHPSLRTTIVADEDDVPRQVVTEVVDVPLHVDDLTAVPGEHRRAEADAHMEREVRRPFDLATGPLVRARLLRHAGERHELLITMHHAICDGWSVGVLVDDLAACYAAATAGAEPALPPLPVRYTDFADWQRRLLDGGARAAQLEYWAERLAGAPAALDLPADRPRPSVPRYVGNALPLRLPADLTARLTDVSRALGVTPFTTLVGVFQLVMGGYAGVRDVSVGTPVSGRTRPEFEHLVGCFINTLVLRTRWTDDLTFAEFLARVRESTLGAYDNQDVPFEDIVELLEPPRVAGRTPLVQVMVAMQNIPAGTKRFPGLSVSVRELASPVAKLDLALRWAEAPAESGELHGFAEYDVDLFDRATVERIVCDYAAVLDAALADPASPLSRLPVPAPVVRAEQAAAVAPVPAATDGEPAFAGEVEAMVVAVWRDVLGLATVAAEDNFFEIGGTSLLALRVQAGLMRTLGRKVQVVDLFRFPTVRTLARHLVAGQETAAGAAGRRKAAARKNLRGARARTGEGGHD